MKIFYCVSSFTLTRLSLAVHPPLAEKKSDEQKEEEVVVHSDLWKTLFRGGYMVGRLTRSLSGAVYVSVLLLGHFVNTWTARLNVMCRRVPSTYCTVSACVCVFILTS